MVRFLPQPMTSDATVWVAIVTCRRHCYPPPPPPARCLLTNGSQLDLPDYLPHRHQRLDYISIQVASENRPSFDDNTETSTTAVALVPQAVLTWNSSFPAEFNMHDVLFNWFRFLMVGSTKFMFHNLNSSNVVGGLVNNGSFLCGTIDRGLNMPFQERRHYHYFMLAWIIAAGARRPISIRVWWDYENWRRWLTVAIWKNRTNRKELATQGVSHPVQSFDCFFFVIIGRCFSPYLSSI